MAGVFKREPLENQPVLTWLKELHMECYGRNLEKYPTLKVRRVHGRVRHVLCSVVTKEHRGVLWLEEKPRLSAKLLACWASRCVRVIFKIAPRA